MSAPRLTQEARARLAALTACNRWNDLARIADVDGVTFGDLRALLADLAVAERERDEAVGHVNGSVLAVHALRAQVAKLREALEECEDYFDQRMDADVVGDPPHYQGNAAMALWVRVRDALAATSAPDQRESEGGSRG